jgi:hypothetical protein
VPDSFTPFVANFRPQSGTSLQPTKTKTSAVDNSGQRALHHSITPPRRIRFRRLPSKNSPQHPSRMTMIPSCWRKQGSSRTRSCAARDQRTAREAILDLARLDRWERRAWSQQKRVILGLMKIRS